MEQHEVKGLIIREEHSHEFPYQVEIVGDAKTVYGSGKTLSSALMRAFSVSNMFPNSRFPIYSKKELARFLFFSFHPSKNWTKAIKALEGE